MLAYDERNSTATWAPVTRVYSHEANDVLVLSIDGEKIETTDSHPFLVNADGWKSAGALATGARVLRIDGRTELIDSSEVDARPIVVYNLEVEDAHTFVVGRQSIIVHNASCPLKINRPPDAETLISKWDKSTFNSTEDSILYHFEKHGGALDIWTYLRRAASFSTKRLRVIFDPETGVSKWHRGKEFLYTRFGKIVTYGKNP